MTKYTTIESYQALMYICTIAEHDMTSKSKITYTELE